MYKFRTGNTVFRRTLTAVFFLFLFCICLIPAEAGGLEVTGPEYSSIYAGHYPTEVTFTDTLTSSSDGQCASVMTQLSGPGVSSPDAHVFTAHPGERFSFRLASPANMRIPFFTTVFGDGQRSTAVHVKGKGIYEITVISQYLEVTGFGFDSDLSDTSADVKLVFSGIGRKIGDSGIEKAPDDETENRYREDENNKETAITVTASARADLILLHDLSEYTCAHAEYEDKLKDPLAESTGFNFRLSETSWTISAAGEPAQNVESDVFQRYDSSWGSGLYYHTPAIVLIGSDLYPRDHLPTDDYDYTDVMNENEKVQEENNARLDRIVNPSEEKTEKKVKPEEKSPKRRTAVTLTKGNLIRKGPGSILSVLGLAVLAGVTAAGSAAISSAVSGSVSSSAGSDQKEEETAKYAVTINGGSGVPDILAGSGRPVSVPVTLEAPDDMPVIWMAAVLPDPDKDLNRRLESLFAECAGGNREARLNILCEPVSKGFHATVRITALSLKDRKPVASELADITVRTEGIHVRRKDGSTIVTLVSEGAVPGSAEVKELSEDEYELSRDENGRMICQLKDGGKEEQL